MTLTTRRRIALLAPVLKQFPELGAGSAKDLADWVALELGSADALDQWIPHGRHWTRARAPRSIYHLAPGNVAVAAWQSLLVGLLLGAENRVKVSSRPGADAALRRFVAALPPPLRKTVRLVPTFRPAELRQAEAVIATGSDETLAEVRRHLGPRQLFLGYGHRVSLLWLGRVTGKESALAQAAARDIALYDQLGCLSPQAIYLEKRSDVAAFGDALAEALAQETKNAAPFPLAAAAQVREARQLARAAGDRLWESAGARWTVVAERQAAFRPGCGYRVIPLRVATRKELSRVLIPLRGSLSTVGLRAPFSAADEALFWGLEAQRLCPVGRCQFPPLSWHHDGRPQLADLVKWVDREDPPLEHRRSP